MAKAGHWVSPEKAIENRRNASQENCSNVVKTQGSASTEPVVFCCGKTAAAALCRGAAAFLLSRPSIRSRKDRIRCFNDRVVLYHARGLESAP